MWPSNARLIVPMQFTPTETVCYALSVPADLLAPTNGCRIRSGGHGRDILASESALEGQPRLACWKRFRRVITGTQWSSFATR